MHLHLTFLVFGMCLSTSRTPTHPPFPAPPCNLPWISRKRFWIASIHNLSVHVSILALIISITPIFIQLSPTRICFLKIGNWIWVSNRHMVISVYEIWLNRLDGAGRREWGGVTLQQREIGLLNILSKGYLYYNFIHCRNEVEIWDTIWRRIYYSW